MASSKGEAGRTGGETSTSAAPLHVENANRSVWLLKVPNFVSKKWKAECDRAAKSNEGHSVELGKVRIANNSTEQTPGIFLDLAASGLDNMPQAIHLREQTDSITPTVVFADLQGRLSAEGRVKRKFDLVMNSSADLDVLDPAYRQLNRDRSAKAAAKTRTMQVLSEAPSSQMRPGTMQRVSFGNKESTRKRFEKGQFERRARMEKDDLENLLFRLFERQSRWNFIQLQKETDQPAVWLKEVLAEVAVLNKRGAHANLWELKKVYRAAVGSDDVEMQGA